MLHPKIAVPDQSQFIYDDQSKIENFPYDLSFSFHRLRFRSYSSSGCRPTCCAASSSVISWCYSVPGPYGWLKCKTDLYGYVAKPIADWLTIKVLLSPKWHTSLQKTHLICATPCAMDRRRFLTTSEAKRTSTATGQNRPTLPYQI